MHQMSPEMQSCIDECLRCHTTCLSTAMNHCLEEGGQHVEPKHFRLMIACAEICQTAANFMLIGTDLHKRFRDAVYVHDAAASSAMRDPPPR